MNPGQVIAGRYEVAERLGVGGMSTVHAAFDRRLERHVAVKLLAEHLAEDQQFVARFRREALSAARLVHPNIVQVFDFGLDESSARHFIVMELIRGRSGAELLRDRGHLALDDTLEIVTQATAGLEYAHRNGVVHRDVKPGNLLRSEEGVVKLADFGIAKAVSEESSITQVGSVLGTASYLAPEQAAGEDAGPAADIYALGVVTYQLASGRLPYEASSLTELALKQQREAPAWLHEVDPDIPEAFAQAVDRALALDPGDRYATAEQMGAALVDGRRGMAPPGVEDPTHPTSVASAATSATRVVPREDRTAAAPAAVVARQPRQPRAGTGPGTSAQPAVAPPPVRRLSRDEKRLARQQARARRRARIKRVVGTFVVLLLLAAGAFAAVVATSDSSSAVHVRNSFSDRANEIIDQLDQLVDDNSK